MGVSGWLQTGRQMQLTSARGSEVPLDIALPSNMARRDANVRAIRA